MQPKESDWKRFRSMLENLRETYLEKKNKEIMAKLTDSNQSPTEQFWAAHELINDEADTLRRLLDGNKRSNMFPHMLGMYHCGMITDEDLNGFSDELQQRIRSIASEIQH